MIDLLTDLQALLEDAVADSDCQVASVVITAGRPSAPSSEGRDCQTRIFVWGQAVADLNQDDDQACIVEPRFLMQYEIWTCYPESWQGSNDDEQETAAACLYELMGLVWCGLVTAKDTGYFGGCRFVELNPMIVQNRSGMAVSALGGVTLPYDCPTVVDSP